MILYSFTKKNYCRLHINKVNNTNITDNHTRILLGITGITENITDNYT